jgi:hypothetical protein
MIRRLPRVLGEADLPWQVKASGVPDAGRHQNPNAPKALMEFLLLGQVQP